MDSLVPVDAADGAEQGTHLSLIIASCVFYSKRKAALVSRQLCCFALGDRMGTALHLSRCSSGICVASGSKLVFELEQYLAGFSRVELSCHDTEYDLSIHSSGWI